MPPQAVDLSLSRLSPRSHPRPAPRPRPSPHSRNVVRRSTWSIAVIVALASYATLAPIVHAQRAPIAATEDRRAEDERGQRPLETPSLVAEASFTSSVAHESPLPFEGRGVGVRGGATQTQTRAAQRTVPVADGAALRAAIALAEDRRAEDDRGLAPIRQGLKGDPALQVLAVRALGRLERVSLVPEIAPLLESSSPAVRMEAANALGQAVLRAEAGPASGPLTARARVETDPAVLGVLARTIGRLPYQQESEVREAERILIEIATKASTAAAPSASSVSSAPKSAAANTTVVDSATLISSGVAHGFDALARRAVKLGSLSADARARLRGLARHGLTDGSSPSAAAGAADSDASRTTPASAGTNAARTQSAAGGSVSERAMSAADAAARVRRLAVSALVTARESNLPLLREVMRDPDDQMRRLGVVWMGTADDMPLRDEAFRQAFGDASPMVRYEALRVHARTRTGASGDCALELSALQDANRHVVLLAIDQLGRCPDAQQATERLTTILTPFFDASSSTPAAASTFATPAAAARSSQVAQAREWHRPAHALVALARVSPDRATPFLARAATNEIWQVRMYAARAAGLLKDRVTLDALAADADDNVRHAAVETLQPLVGHDADPQYLASLDRSDYQLLREASRALAGTPRKPEASTALLSAFVRISKDRRDTSRDARIAILDTLEETGKGAPASTNATANTGATASTGASATAAPSGSATSSARAGAGTATGADTGARPATRMRATTDADVVALRPYLADFDPVVAARVAMLLTAWTGQGHTATSTSAGGTGASGAATGASGGAVSTAKPGGAGSGGATGASGAVGAVGAAGAVGAVGVPSPREIERLARTRATVRMARGGTFTLALLPTVAPTNVARFVRLARAGYFNGLTLHRVEPNFVVQGGSPGANEYMGDAAYTRDELDLTSNERGTIGISTRGRDTGDGQIYVNLVDNARLDHNYTVFAEVVEGMPVVDGILEGDVITRIELRERP
jgi:cyclophilin family peptidyl-prolyl cis-trans isomerase/HEAT repeat protein